MNIFSAYVHKVWELYTEKYARKPCTVHALKNCHLQHCVIWDNTTHVTRLMHNTISILLHWRVLIEVCDLEHSFPLSTVFVLWYIVSFIHLYDKSSLKECIFAFSSLNTKKVYTFIKQNSTFLQKGVQAWLVMTPRPFRRYSRESPSF